MVNRTAVASGLLLVACASAGPAPAPAPSASSATGEVRPGQPPVIVRGIRPLPPDSLPGWTLVEQNSESIDLGVWTRYRRSDGLDIDTYVYPVPAPDAACPTECLRSWATGEADGFRDEGPARFVEAGYFSELTLSEDRELPAPLPGFTPIRHLTFDATDTDGSEGRSDFLLVAGRGYRVKLRTTDYADLADSTTAVAALLDLVAGIEWPYTCTVAPSADTTSGALESMLAVRPETLVDGTPVAPVLQTHVTSTLSHKITEAAGSGR